MVVAPALIAASMQRHRKSCSVRVPSSQLHSTSSVKLRARVTEEITISYTVCGSICSFHFIWTGEVEMKVWMRPRRAGLIASPARSMSFWPARASPHTTAFLARRAISWTAAKSPSEATGKPASMMSTPMASSSSATSSFSSWVMVAPGDCSPSRKVVSKMTTRSCSDCTGVVMAKGPSGGSRPLRGARGFRGSGQPPECPGTNAQPALRG